MSLRTFGFQFTCFVRKQTLFYCVAPAVILVRLEAGRLWGSGGGGQAVRGSVLFEGKGACEYRAAQPSLRQAPVYVCGLPHANC